MYFTLVQGSLANRRLYGEDQPDPFPAEGTINCWPPWDIYICLVLAPDPSAKKTQYRNNLTKSKGQKNWGKGYAVTGRAQRRNFLEDLRRPTLSRIRTEYMSFDGTVTMILRVVAPQTPCDDQWILRRPPNPNLVLLASPNLEDEIPYKGGRFVTSQNSKFWNVIKKR